MVLYKIGTLLRQVGPMLRDLGVAIRTCDLKKAVAVGTFFGTLLGAADMFTDVYASVEMTRKVG